jgi:hypothetical protein
MSKVQQIRLTNPDGVTLATKGKYCPHALRVTPRLASLTVTANGTYPVPAGFAGYGTITVEVSQAGISCQHALTDTVVLREPTCTEAGEATVICRECGAAHAQVLPCLSHRDTESVIEPTCERGGYTLHTCTLCGRSYTDSETARLGHLWGDPEPDSAFSSGYSITCSRCGAKEEASV